MAADRPDGSWAKTGRSVEEVIDRSGDRAILGAREGVRAAKQDYAAIGDVGEAAIGRHLVERLNHEVLHLNTTPHERGIDLVTFDQDTGQIYVWEVKSSLSDQATRSRPRMGETNSGRQLSNSWLQARLKDAGLESTDWSDVEARAVKIDLKTGEARVWIVDPATGSKERVDDVIDISDLLDLEA